VPSELAREGVKPIDVTDAGRAALGAHFGVTVGDREFRVPEHGPRNSIQAGHRVEGSACCVCSQPIPVKIHSTVHYYR
jgi:hypothetical protein